MHNTDSLRLHDDCLMVSLNGPRSVAEFDEGVEDARESLTPFSSECASLWRQLMGSRRGHYNAQATLAAKRAMQALRGTVIGTTRGALSAARLAVLSSRLRRRRGQGSFRDLHEGREPPRVHCGLNRWIDSNIEADTIYLVAFRHARSQVRPS